MGELKLITGCEQRDFLLFMPTNPSGSPLEAALSYYSSIVTLNAEGDSMVTEETLEGIGTTGFLLHALFGSIVRLAQPAPPDPSPNLNQPGPTTATSTATDPSSQPTSSSRKPPISSQLKPPLEDDPAATANTNEMAAAYANTPQPAAGSVQGTIQQVTGEAVRSLKVIATSGTSFGGSSRGSSISSDDEHEFLDIHDHHPQLQWRELDDEECEDKLTKSRLTQYLPEPGYFLAGALAGGISRTATAPLDRLKVYLLVNTKTKAGVAADVVKQGQPLAAVRAAGKPIGDAVHALWKAGGFRTFFAGKSSLCFGMASIGRLFAQSESCCQCRADICHREWAECDQDHARDCNQSMLLHFFPDARRISTDHL